MLFILFLGVLFVSFFYYQLSEKYNKNILLSIVLGIVLFLISYYMFSLVLVLFINVLMKIHFSTLLIDCFTIPLEILVSGIAYKLMESNFKKNQNIVSVEDIGKKDEMNL